MPLDKKDLEVLNKLKKGLKRVLRDNFIELDVFGSKVRGDADEESDIDVLILVKKGGSEVLDLVAEEVASLKLSTDLPLSPVVYTVEEFNVNKRLGSPFVHSIEQESIKL